MPNNQDQINAILGGRPQMTQQQSDVNAILGGGMDPSAAKASLGHSNNFLVQALQGGWGALTDVATGVAKGGTQTLMGIGTLGQKVEQGIGTAVGAIPGVNVSPEAKGETGVFNPASPAGQQAREIVSPSNTTQAVAKGTEQIAEFALPAGIVGDTEKAISASSKIGGFTKWGLKALTEATAGGGVDLAQTLDPKHAGITALTFGALKGVTGAVGAGLKGLGVPEHLYSSIFKTASQDMLAELKTGGIQALQKAEPELYQKLVGEGIIKVGADGTPIVNETLARQALNRGLRGSIGNMANTLVRGLFTSEAKARAIAKNARELITIPGSDKLSNLLETVAHDYENVGQGEFAQKARGLLDTLTKGGGIMNAEDTLKMRRFLDGMRTRASYNPQATLSTTAENFKYWSDTLRKEVNKIPGMGPVMKEYGFNIDALESLAKTAAQKGNQQLVSMLDVLIFEGGLEGGVPGLGATMSLGRKGLQTAFGSTMTGSAIENAGSMSRLGGFLKGAFSKLTGGAADQGTQ